MEWIKCEDVLPKENKDIIFKSLKDIDQYDYTLKKDYTYNGVIINNIILILYDGKLRDVNNYENYLLWLDETENKDTERLDWLNDNFIEFATNYNINNIRQFIDTRIK